MARRKTTVRGRAALARDSQQYLDKIACPTLLWIFADQHHMPSVGGGDSGTNNWAAPLHGAMCDWLRDRFADKPLRYPGQAVYVEPNGAGPNAATVTLKRKWYET